jgi:hypothetical protein
MYSFWRRSGAAFFRLRDCNARVAGIGRCKGEVIFAGGEMPLGGGFRISLYLNPPPIHDIALASFGDIEAIHRNGLIEPIEALTLDLPRRNTMLKLNAAAILILSAVVATGANAAGLQAATAGVSANAVDRAITVKPGAKYINVVNNETVSITVGDHTFSWHVDTFPNKTVFDLAQIAPEGVQTAGVKVYVAPDPIYFGG